LKNNLRKMKINEKFMINLAN